MDEPGSLFDAVKAAVPGIPYRDKLAWIKEQLGPLADDLDRLIGDPAVPCRFIHAELVRRGFEVSRRAVDEWCRQTRLKSDG